MRIYSTLVTLATHQGSDEYKLIKHFLCDTRLPLSYVKTLTHEGFCICQNSTFNNNFVVKNLEFVKIIIRQKFLIGQYDNFKIILIISKTLNSSK